MRPNPYPAFLQLPSGKVIGNPVVVTGAEAPNLVIKTPAERKAAKAAHEVRVKAKAEAAKQAKIEAAKKAKAKAEAAKKKAAAKAKAEGQEEGRSAKKKAEAEEEGRSEEEGRCEAKKKANG